MKLEINKGCFTENVRIDGESLFKSEHDTRTDLEIGSLRQKILDEISDIKSELDMSDWVQIVEILSSRSIKFEYDLVNSQDYKSCDQCGDYSYNHIYIKKEDGHERNNTE